MKKLKLESNEIVSSLKSYTNFIQKYYREDIDFMGCSESYVEEKINHLIYNLQHFKKFLRSVDREKIRISKIVDLANPNE